MEEHEKVECNDSNESCKNRYLQKHKNGLLQRGNQLWRENMISDPGLSLSSHME